MKITSLHKIFLAATLLAALLLAACKPLDRTGMVHEDSGMTPKQQKAFDDLYRAAMRYKLAHKGDVAYELFSQALKINPNAPEALIEIARYKRNMVSYFDSIGNLQADSLYARAIQLAPNNLDYKKELAEELFSRSEYKSAQPLYEDIVKIKPVNTEDLKKLKEIYEATGEYKAALRTIAELEELEGTDEDYVVSKAKIFLAQQDSASTYKMLEGLRKKYPEDHRYSALLSDNYVIYGDTLRAWNFLKSLGAEQSEEPFLQIALMNYYRFTSNSPMYDKMLRRMALNKNANEDMRFDAIYTLFDEAKSYNDSLEIFDLAKQSLQLPTETSSPAKTLLVIAHLTLEMPLETLEPVFENILSHDAKLPNSAFAREYCAFFKWRKGNVEEALQLCREGQKFIPQDQAFYSMEAAILSEQGNNAAALEAMKRGEKYVDREEYFILFMGSVFEQKSHYYSIYSDILWEMGDKAGAIEKAEKSVKADTTDATAMNNFAYLLARCDTRLDEAEKLILKAIEIEPGETYMLDTYAWVLYKQGRYKEARKYIDMVVNSGDSINSTELDHAGDIYLRCGDKKKAREFWRKALLAQPNADEEKAIRKKLKNKR